MLLEKLIIPLIDKMLSLLLTESPLTEETTYQIPLDTENQLPLKNSQMSSNHLPQDHSNLLMKFHLLPTIMMDH